MSSMKTPNNLALSALLTILPSLAVVGFYIQQTDTMAKGNFHNSARPSSYIARITREEGQ